MRIFTAPINHITTFNFNYLLRLFFVLLIVTVGLQQAKAQFKCVISGTVKKDKDRLELAVVTLYKGKQVVQQISTTSNGKFVFNLEPGGEYTVNVTRAGSVNKKILYSTMGITPENAKNFAQTIQPEIELFEMPKDANLVSQINAIVSQPVGKFYYDPRSDGIANDEAYAASMQSALATLRKLQEEAERKAAEENAKYKDAIDRGDEAFTKRDYATAKAAFVEASAIKTFEVYPKNRIADCDKMLADAASDAEKEAKYKAALAKGDAAMTAKDYTAARAAYNEAVEIRPNQQYPRTKLAEIDKLLGDAEKNAAKEAKYKAAIDKGDAALAAKDYTNAKAAYYEALGIKEKEKYPTDKLAEIDKILGDLAAKEKADKALTEKYNLLIAKGDKSLGEKSLMDAKTAYTAALALKPNEQYPKDKLAEVNALIEKDAGLKELEAKYLAAIAKGDKALGAKNYADAKTAYTDALGLKPNEQYPKDKLAEIAAILDKEMSAKQLEENYKAAISKGDAALAAKSYDNAKSAYNEALGLKPNEKYPKDKLAEIDKLIAADLSAKELNDKYNAAIDKADAAFGKQDYTTAKAGYMEALGFKPTETYPKVKLAAIDKILADQAADKVLTEKYNILISKADNFLVEKKYTDAKTMYNEALKLKPNEQYPKDKITEIDAILAKLMGEKQLEESYKAAVAKGDKAFEAKDYQASKDAFTEAKGLKPMEEYPKYKLEQLEKLMADEQAAKVLEERYKAAIAKGDVGLSSKDYVNAKAAYNEALGIKPNEKYPVDKIAEIDRLIAAEMSEKELTQKYNAAIGRADAAFGTKDYSTAKTEYNNALGFKPAEKYPKDKIDEINKILGDLASEKEKNEKYQAAIARGDLAFDAKTYEAAKGNYNEALSYKPNEQYPKDKITEIDAILAKEAADRKRDENYKAAIAEADAAMITKNYELAKADYTDANTLKPLEEYPKYKLEQLEKLMAEEARLKELKDRYNAAIAKADAAFTSLEYQNAKTEYTTALSILPNEQYPRTKIGEIDRLLAEIAAREQAERERTAKYNELIAKADKAFGMKTYLEAKSLYSQASKTKPMEQYPKDKIAEIDDLIAKEEANRKNEEYYKAAIARGDFAFTSKDYANAKSNFEAASRFKPNEQYPKDKIAAINTILENAEKARKLEEDYKKAVIAGNGGMNAGDYENAKASFTEASRLKPNEQYPKDQIAKINKIIADLAREKMMKEKYAAAITKADAAFANKEYAVALTSYKEAQTYKPAEPYPASRISDINRILDGLARQKEKDARYNATIINADKLFASRQYQKARGVYSDALLIKPTEQYPKDKMAEIDVLLRKTGAPASASVVKKEEVFNDLAQRYPEGVTEEYATEMNASLIKRIVVKGHEGHLYIQKTTKFGAIYWTRDGVPITEQEYIKKTEQ